MVVDSATTVGLNLKGDFATAAIFFQQPRRTQPIKRHYAHPKNSFDDQQKTGITRAVSAPPTVPKEATLTVSRSTEEFQFEGGGIQAGGPVSNVAGISGDATPARNLCSRNVPVETEATTIKIHFAQPEANADYAIFVEHSWLTNRAISGKQPERFTIKFSDAAAQIASLDWMIVR